MFVIKAIPCCLLPGAAASISASAISGPGNSLKPEVSQIQLNLELHKVLNQSLFLPCPLKREVKDWPGGSYQESL